MGEPLVVLSGDEASLAAMSVHFASPRLAVTHEGGDTGFLKSSEFASSGDDARIIDAAGQLILLANGVMRRRDPRRFQPVNVRPAVVREDETGKRTLSISVHQTAVISATEGASVVKYTLEGVTILKTGSHAESDEPVPLEPPLVDVLLALSGDEIVAKALVFYCYRDNWPLNLYKVYETVGMDVCESKIGRKITFSVHKQRLMEVGWQEIAARRWATQADTIRFRQTVHSPEILGDQARHAVQMTPAPVYPMPEEEAKEFIGTVLESWFREKHAGRA